MDEKLFTIHSARFYHVEPKAIHSMCYEEETKRLALSRSDNSIEIWNMVYAIHLEKHIPGSSDASVEALVWSKGKLYSTGLHGFVVEYDLVTLSPKASYSVTSGSAWCLSVNKAHTHIAAGTEEGYVCLFEIVPDGGLLYYKVFDKQEGRILSLSWHSSGDFIVTGSQDAIRVWNVATGHAVQRITPGRSERNKETLVWCVAVTDDFLIISGDSRGTTSFWDGKLGTLMGSVTAHKADVLCLCLSEDQQTVYSAGVDPSIVLFARVTLNGGRQQWIRSVQRAIHTHDVRSMTLAGPKLISGGVDAYLCVSSYPPKTLSKYPPLPEPPSIHIAGEKRLMLLCNPTSLDVWQLGSALKSSRGLNANTFLKLTHDPVHLLQLFSRDDEHIICAAISSDGKYLAYSSESAFRIYHLNQDNTSPQLQKMIVPPEIKFAHRMIFVAKDKLLLATPELSLHLLDLSYSSEEPVKISHTFNKESKLNFQDSIHLMDATKDGKFAVIADHRSNIYVIDLHLLKIHSTLPRYKSHPNALAFHPNCKDIVVAYSDHKIVEYDIIQKQYTPFSRKLSSHLPAQWLNRSSTVRHIIFDPRLPDVIILHDDSVICTIDKNKEFGEPETKMSKLDHNEDSMDTLSNLTSTSSQSPSHHLRTTIGGNCCFALSKKYKHLVFLGCIDAGELIAVEVSPLALEKHLPPALYKKRFGV